MMEKFAVRSMHLQHEASPLMGEVDVFLCDPLCGVCGSAG